MRKIVGLVAISLACTAAQAQGQMQAPRIQMAKICVQLGNLAVKVQEGAENGINLAEVLASTDKSSALYYLQKDILDYAYTAGGPNGAWTYAVETCGMNIEAAYRLHGAGSQLRPEDIVSTRGRR